MTITAPEITDEYLDELVWGKDRDCVIIYLDRPCGDKAVCNAAVLCPLHGIVTIPVCEECLLRIEAGEVGCDGCGTTVALA